MRVERDPDVHNARSDVIEKLTQQETDITRTLFERLDENAHTQEERIARREHNIDPYWDPFRKVEETREKVVAEFDEYAKLVSAADAKIVRTQIRKALLKNRMRYDSYSLDFRRWLKRLPAEKIPVPHKIHEQFWERSGLQKQLARERITWRDPDIIQHFRAANGYILPRRITKLSKRKQMDLVKAVRIAQQMAVIPFDWNSNGSETMPLMDPVQWMSHRVSRQVEKDKKGKIHKGEIRNARAASMMAVMTDETSVNSNYFKHLVKNRADQPGLSFEEKLRKIRESVKNSNLAAQENQMYIPARDPPVFHG
jgi:ribosomal protein S18